MPSFVPVHACWIEACLAESCVHIPQCLAMLSARVFDICLGPALLCLTSAGIGLCLGLLIDLESFHALCQASIWWSMCIFCCVWQLFGLCV